MSARVQCTLAAQPKSGEDTMAKEEAVKETPKEIFLKDYKAPDYAFEKVLSTEDSIGSTLASIVPYLLLRAG